MEALGRFGENATAAIPKLMTLARQPDQMWGAISALSLMGTNAVPGLMDLYRDGTPGQHSMAAKTFIKRGANAAAAVPILVEDLTDESANRVALAALVLGGIGEKGRVAIPGLVELTHDENAEVRLRAAAALWRLDRKTNTVLPVLILELETWSKKPNALRSRSTDQHGKARHEIVAEILGKIGLAARKAVPLLQMMMRGSFDERKKPPRKLFA